VTLDELLLKGLARLLRGMVDQSEPKGFVQAKLLGE